MNHAAYGYAPAPASQPGYGRQEQWFLNEQGVQVTSARFVVGQQMYPLNGITSISPFSFRPSRALPLLMIAFWGFGVVLAIMPLFRDGSVAPLLVCAALLALSIKWFVSKAEKHGVFVSTAGMQQRALITTDAALVGRVVHALNQAIAVR